MTYHMRRLERIDIRIDLLNEITVPALTDNDLFGNIFLTEKEHKIVGVVDFERALYGDPYMDFASCVTLFDNLDDAGGYISGYEAQIGHPLNITAMTESVWICTSFRKLF